MVRQQRQANFDLIYSPWPCLFYVYSRKDIRYILQKAKVEREGDRIIYDSYIVHSYPYDTTPMMDQTPPFCLVRPSLCFACWTTRTPTSSPLSNYAIRSTFKKNRENIIMPSIQPKRRQIKKARIRRWSMQLHAVRHL